jgi:predicted nucleotide-binding protein
MEREQEKLMRQVAKAMQVARSDAAAGAWQVWERHLRAYNSVLRQALRYRQCRGLSPIAPVPALDGGAGKQPSADRAKFLEIVSGLEHLYEALGSKQSRSRSGISSHVDRQDGNLEVGAPERPAHPASSAVRGREPDAAKGRRVFVIYGRDERLRRGIFDFLRAIGLEPLEWSQLLSLTAKASPYIGEILDRGFSQVQAVVALLSADEIVRLREELAKPGTGDEAAAYQPRPNVLFESGMAFALHPDRTVLVEIGPIRAISDVAGRHIVKMDGSRERRQELAQRLRSAGCSVNTDGADWYTAGDLTPLASVSPAMVKGKRS